MTNTLERKIPTRLDASILSPLIGWDFKDVKDGGAMPTKTVRTPEIYVERIEEFEIKAEKSLIKTLAAVGIGAMVKTDRYSLPYTKEIKVTLNGESYLNGPYELIMVTRKVVKQLLEENQYKIRFYLYVEVDSEGGRGPFKMGCVNYHFRYYTH